MTSTAYDGVNKALTPEQKMASIFANKELAKRGKALVRFCSEMK